MLFEIDPSIVVHLESNSVTAADFEAINYICLGVAEGSHRIIGQRRTLLTLAANANVAQRSRGVLNRAANRVAQDGGLHHRLHVYGRIVASNNNTPVSVSIGKQRVIYFPLRWFDSSAKVQPTLVIGENLWDAHSIRKIGEVGAVLAGWRYQRLNLEPVHGGGSTINQVLLWQSNSNRLCLCVVDSDSGCPGGAMGATAVSVQQFKDATTYPLIEVLETFGRDLENTLPDSFYRTMYSGHTQFGQMATVLCLLTQESETELRAHIDIEKGVTLQRIFRYPAGSPEYVFWNTKLPVLMAYHKTAPVLPCLSTGACQADGTHCACIVVRGNSENILERFVKETKETTNYDIEEQLDNSVRPEWLRLGSVVASWCCAEDRLRV